MPLRGEELTEEYLDGVVLPRLERALEIAICAGLTRLAQSDACGDPAGSVLTARSLSEMEHAAGIQEHLADCGLRGQA